MLKECNKQDLVYIMRRLDWMFFHFSLVLRLILENSRLMARQGPLGSATQLRRRAFVPAARQQFPGLVLITTKFRICQPPILVVFLF